MSTQDTNSNPKSDPDRLRSIFNEVVDLQPTERAAALGRLCGDDASLRAELDALLASHDAARVGGFMTSPTAATTVRTAPITEAPGSRVGPYKLLQVIGEGGFGTVFLAEQTEPVRRRVALKIIKLGMDTKQVIARFEAERQALALMDHPHIARVLDAGATPITEHGGGRPYFVMEYVVGDAITQFAANNNLDLSARLQLFAQVCSAVQHAHTKGIIHRDIKPGNVLVTMTDGKPFARVIDFGIAKATSAVGGLTDKTLFTEHRQLIGTPEYMSPEQAQGSPDIDTRTDVYALGVLLYELLAGDTPFDGKRLRSAAWDEMRRIIKEEDPPTPSARVTQRMKGSGSASSPSVPPPLRPSAPSELRGELDWIVMKSLDKDRARRYETPSALAADVERHLKGEAVQAAPPSAAYRLRKFVRRNKGPVIAGSAVAAALLVGIAGTTIGMWRASVAEAEATHQAFVAGRNAAAANMERFKAETQRDFAARSGRALLALLNGEESNTDLAFVRGINQAIGERSAADNGQGPWDPDDVATHVGRDLSGLSALTLDTARKVIEAQVQLRAQTDAAKATLSDMFLLGTSTPGGMDAGVPVFPPIRDEPGYRLVAELKGGGAEPHSFEFWKYKHDESDPTQVIDRKPLEDAKVLPALADTALGTVKKAIALADAAEWSAYTANLALAQAAMDAGNWPEARERLAQCPESKRGWEWRWLSEKAAAVVGEVRAETTIRSPDASLVIAADSKSLRIATPDGVDIGSPIVFPSWVNSVSFSADSSAFMVALAAENPRDRAYQVFTRQGDPVGGADASPLIARNALLSPDGERLIAVTPKQSGSYDIQLFDATGHAMRVLAQSETEHYEAAWSGDGARVALVAGNRLAIWTRDGESVASLDAPDDRVGKPALSPNGSLAVFVRVPGGEGNRPRTELWTMGASEPASLPIPADFPQTVTFSPDGEYAYIRLWGHRDLHVIHDGKVVEHIISPDDMLSDPIFGPDGTRFLLTTRTTVRVHERDGRLSGAPISHGSGWVDSACFAPDGASFYTASYHRGAIERRDLGGRLLERISIGASLHDVACTPEGLVSVSLLNPISDIATSRLLLAPHAGMSDRAFSSSIADVGRLEAAARNQDNVQRAPAPTAPPSIAQNATHRVATPDAERVISAAADRVVRFWDVATGKETASIRVDSDITSIDLSPDGEAITIRFADGSLRVLDARPSRDQTSDIQGWNDELAPAQALIDALIAGPLDTDSLMDAIVNDKSLTPTRRLVASELLEARTTALSLAASAAFDRILSDAEKATDAWKMVDTKAIKAHITAAAAALQPSDTLPPRAIEKVIARAQTWEYSPSAPSAEERLAEEEKKRRLAEADVAVRSVDAGAGDQQAAIDRAAVLDAIRTYRDLRVTHDESRYQAVVAALAAVNIKEDRYVWAESALRAGDLSYALNLILEAPRDRLTPVAGPNESPNMPESVDSAWTKATPCELSILAMVRFKLMAAAPEWIAAAARVDQRILGSTMSADELQAAARSALSRAREIMADPSALDDSGRPWSENPDAQALLKEAEELIERETQGDHE